MTNIKKKNVGGRGKAEKLRNEALVVLYKLDKKKFRPVRLASLFGLDRSTVSRNIHRDISKYLGDKDVAIVDGK